MKYVPMRHQQIAIDFCLSHPKAGLFIGMGLGKTSVALTVFADYKWEQFTAKKALVVAPTNVAKTVWAQECQKWDHLNDIRCSLLAYTDAKKRRKMLAKDADLYIINRENLIWLIDELGGSLKMFDMVILDELSSFKDQSTKRWKAVKSVIQPVPYVLGLTGTPAPNSYIDLWPQVYLLDGGERLGKRIGDYRSRYFTMGAHRGHIVYEWRLRIGAQDAINRKLSDLCLSMQSEDWLDLPPVLYRTVHVQMDTKAKKTYRDFEETKVIPLLRKDSEVIALNSEDLEEVEQMTNVVRGKNAAVAAGKLLQMANGAVYDDEKKLLPIHDAKLDALAEIVDTNPGCNLLVFFNYQHDLDRIRQRFSSSREFNGEQDERDWNAGKIPMLLCHPASAGHGLNLQYGGHIIVWFGLTWSLELYQQANARLPRPGQTESVIVHHLVCEGTIDEKIMAALQQKDATQSALLEALKGYLKEGS